MKRSNKLLAFFLAASMALSIMGTTVFAAEEKTNIFSDVYETSWFYDAVQYVNDQKIMVGTSDVEFSPYVNVNRAMVVTTLYRMEDNAEKPSTASSFSDVKDGVWYTDAVIWAEKNGIAQGYEDGTFQPLQPLSREALVTFLYRWAKYKGRADIATTSDMKEFVDVGSVHSYAKEAMGWAIGTGLVKGMTADTISPASTANRAQLAMILYQLRDQSVEVEDPNTPLADRPNIGGGSRPSGGGGGGGGGGGTHTHRYTYTAWTQNGTQHTRTGTCSCGNTITETGAHSYTNGEWTPTSDGAQHTRTNTCSVCGATTTETAAHNYTNDSWTQTADGTQHTHTRTCSVCNATTAETENHTYDKGVCVCGAIAAPNITATAVTTLNNALADIKGHEGAPLVTVTQDGNKVSAVLDTDAIMGSGASFGDDQLNGLMTNIKKALDDTFGDYTLTVNGEEVYSKEAFNNTALKNALFDVSNGFFYTLANMKPEDGVCTYKTVNAVVTNINNGQDTYEFAVDVQLKGNDVDKVQKMAGILADHLSMTKMTAEQVKSEYGTKVTGENEYIVVGMEMPDKIMSTLEQVLKEAGKGITPEQITQYFNGAQVGTILNVMGQAKVEDLVGSGVPEVETLVNMVNGNANLINKVMGKLTIKAGETKLFEGNFTPGDQEDAWQKAMAGVLGMMTDEGKQLTPGTFATSKPDYYLVPITVDIDLDSSMGFKATETVLFKLHIPLSKLGADPEPPVKTAEDVTKGTIDTLSSALAGITGNDSKQLVTVTQTDDGYTMALNTDAIKGAGESFSDDQLTGLMTKIKDALDDNFAGYTLSVNGEEVYTAEGKFNNTKLKDAMFSVSDGFFYTLANMTPDADGAYTYKTIKAVVAGEGDDTYRFDLDVRLSGEDVSKVQSMASILADHLSMTKMTAAKVQEDYGVTISGESEYIVVGMEMPDAIMSGIRGYLASEEAIAEFINRFNNNAEVERILSIMATLDLNDMIGSGQAEVETLISMLNGNQNLVNKVLSKLTFKVQTIAEVEGKDSYNGLLIKEGATFAPATADWKGVVDAIVRMLDENGGNVVPGQFKSQKEDHYLVPITVDIDLDSSMGFKATETVLFDLHIPLSELGGTTEPDDPTEKTDEQVTKEAVAKVQEVLKSFTGHGGTQLVTLTETEDGDYDLNLDVSAVVAGDIITDGTGLATELGEAMAETFGDLPLTVNGNIVYADGEFNHTKLKDALFSMSDGFFYTLANMGNDGVYKTVTAAVGDYSFEVNVKLSGDDVTRVKELAGKLEKYLSMNKMDAADVAEEYGYKDGGESEYIVIGVEMPPAVQDFLSDNKSLTAETFNAIPVMTAINGLAHYDVPSMLGGSNAANINPVIETVNGNADLINTVLRHVSAKVNGKDFITKGSTFTRGSADSAWQEFMLGVIGMIDTEYADSNDVIGSYYQEGSDGIYVVPVTVDIDLEDSLSFTANETVLVVLHIPFTATVEEVTE